MRDSWSPRDGASADRVVIHIQDAHCNYDAQKKINDIIGYAAAELGAESVYLEGGEGAYDTSVFTSIGNAAERQAVADQFLKAGLINGAEYFAVNNPEKVSLWGIENAGLYLDNLRIYRQSRAGGPAAEASIKRLSSILAALKLRIYPKPLLQFDVNYSQFKAGTIDLKAYIIYLTGVAAERSIDMRQFSHLEDLKISVEREAGIDFVKANQQRDQLIDILQKSLSRREVEELVEMVVRLRTGSVSQKDFCGHLVRKAAALGLDMSLYAELSKFLDYLSAYAAVDSLAAMAEIEALEGLVKNALCENDTQAELVRLSKNLIIMKSLFAVSLAKPDYDYYKANKRAFDVQNYVAFIDREAPRRGIAAELAAGTSGLDALRHGMEQFYEYSLKRDEAFIRNIKLERHGAEGMAHGVAIVVTGGFHTENLCELFRKNNIAYVSILPNFRNDKGYECPYFRLLAGNPYTEFVKMARSSGLSALAIASNLNPLGRKAAEAGVSMQADIENTIPGMPALKAGAETKEAVMDYLKHLSRQDPGLSHRATLISDRVGFLLKFRPLVTSGIAPVRIYRDMYHFKDKKSRAPNYFAIADELDPHNYEVFKLERAGGGKVRLTVIGDGEEVVFDSRSVGYPLSMLRAGKRFYDGLAIRNVGLNDADKVGKTGANAGVPYSHTSFTGNKSGIPGISVNLKPVEDPLKKRCWLSPARGYDEDDEGREVVCPLIDLKSAALQVPSSVPGLNEVRSSAGRLVAYPSAGWNSSEEWLRIRQGGRFGYFRRVGTAVEEGVEYVVYKRLEEEDTITAIHISPDRRYFWLDGLTFDGRPLTFSAGNVNFGTLLYVLLNDSAEELGKLPLEIRSRLRASDKVRALSCDLADVVSQNHAKVPTLLRKSAEAGNESYELGRYLNITWISRWGDDVKEDLAVRKLKEVRESIFAAVVSAAPDRAAPAAAPAEIGAKVEGREIAVKKQIVTFPSCKTETEVYSVMVDPAVNHIHIGIGEGIQDRFRINNRATETREYIDGDGNIITNTQEIEKIFDREHADSVIIDAFEKEYPAEQVVAAMDNCCLFANEGFATYVNGSLHRFAGEDITGRSYTSFIVLKSGAVTMGEALYDMVPGFEPKWGEPLQVNIFVDGTLRKDVAYATFGQFLLGRDIESIIPQFQDLRHVFGLAKIDIGKIDLRKFGLDPAQIIGSNEKYLGSAELSSDSYKLAKKGWNEAITLSASVDLDEMVNGRKVKRTVPVPEDILFQALKDAGYTREERPSYKGSFSYRDGRLLIFLKEGVYPRTIVGVTQDGKLGGIEVIGKSGRIGCTIREAAKLASDMGFKQAMLLDHGKSAKMQANGKYLIPDSKRGDYRYHRNSAILVTAPKEIATGARFAESMAGRSVLVGRARAPIDTMPRQNTAAPAAAPAVRPKAPETPGKPGISHYTAMIMLAVFLRFAPSLYAQTLAPPDLPVAGAETSARAKIERFESALADYRTRNHEFDSLYRQVIDDQRVEVEFYDVDRGYPAEFRTIEGANGRIRFDLAQFDGEMAGKAMVVALAEELYHAKQSRKQAAWTSWIPGRYLRAYIRGLISDIQIVIAGRASIEEGAFGYKEGVRSDLGLPQTDTWDELKRYYASKRGFDLVRPLLHGWPLIAVLAGLYLAVKKIVRAVKRVIASRTGAVRIPVIGRRLSVIGDYIKDTAQILKEYWNEEEIRGSAARVRISLEIALQRMAGYVRGPGLPDWYDEDEYSPEEKRVVLQNNLIAAYKRSGSVVLKALLMKMIVHLGIDNMGKDGAPHGVFHFIHEEFERRATSRTVILQALDSLEAYVRVKNLAQRQLDADHLHTSARLPVGYFERELLGAAFRREDPSITRSAVMITDFGFRQGLARPYSALAFDISETTPSQLLDTSTIHPDSRLSDNKLFNTYKRLSAHEDPAISERVKRWLSLLEAEYRAGFDQVENIEDFEKAFKDYYWWRRFWGQPLTRDEIKTFAKKYLNFLGLRYKHNEDVRRWGLMDLGRDKDLLRFLLGCAVSRISDTEPPVNALLYDYLLGADQAVDDRVIRDIEMIFTYPSGRFTADNISIEQPDPDRPLDPMESAWLQETLAAIMSSPLGGKNHVDLLDVITMRYSEERYKLMEKLHKNRIGENNDYPLLALRVQSSIGSRFVRAWERMSLMAAIEDGKRQIASQEPGSYEIDIKALADKYSLSQDAAVSLATALHPGQGMGSEADRKRPARGGRVILDHTTSIPDIAEGLGAIMAYSNRDERRAAAKKVRVIIANKADQLTIDDIRQALNLGTDYTDKLAQVFEIGAIAPRAPPQGSTSAVARRSPFLKPAILAAAIVALAGGLAAVIIPHVRLEHEYRSLVDMKRRLESNPNMVVQTAESIGARRYSVTVQGSRIEVIGGAHGAPQGTDELIQLSREIIRHPKDWIFIIESLPSSRNIHLPLILSDLAVADRLSKDHGIPIEDVVPTPSDPDVLERVQQMTGLSSGEIVEAQLLQRAHFFMNEAKRTGAKDFTRVFMLFQVYAQMNLGIDPQKVREVLSAVARKAAASEEAASRLRSDAITITGIEDQARNEVGRKRLEELIARNPGKNIAALVGSRHVQIFGISGTEHDRKMTAYPVDAAGVRKFAGALLRDLSAMPEPSAAGDASAPPLPGKGTPRAGPVRKQYRRIAKKEIDRIMRKAGMTVEELELWSLGFYLKVWRDSLVDPLTVDEHVKVFKYLCSCSGRGAHPVLTAIAIKMISSRSWDVITDIINRSVDPDIMYRIARKLKLTIEEKETLWRMFHDFMPSKSNRTYAELSEAVRGTISDGIRSAAGTASVLDLGCGGQGATIRGLKAAYGEKVKAYGIDIALEDAMADGVDLRQGDATEGLPYPDASFDVVYEAGVLEYFEQAADLEKVIKEVARVLKPGGQFMPFSVAITDSDLRAKIRDYLGEGFAAIQGDPFVLEKERAPAEKIGGGLRAGMRAAPADGSKSGVAAGKDVSGKVAAGSDMPEEATIGAILQHVLRNVRYPDDRRVFFIPHKGDRKAYDEARADIKYALKKDRFRNISVIFYDGTAQGLDDAYAQAGSQLNEPGALALAYVDAAAIQPEAVRAHNEANARFKWIAEHVPNGVPVEELFMHVAFGLPVLDFVKNSQDQEQKRILIDLIEKMVDNGQEEIGLLKADLNNIFVGGIILALKKITKININAEMHMRDRSLKDILSAA